MLSSMCQVSTRKPLAVGFMSQPASDDIPESSQMAPLPRTDTEEATDTQLLLQSVYCSISVDTDNVGLNDRLAAKLEN